MGGKKDKKDKKDKKSKKHGKHEDDAMKETRPISNLSTRPPTSLGALDASKLSRQPSLESLFSDVPSESPRPKSSEKKSKKDKKEKKSKKHSKDEEEAPK